MSDTYPTATYTNKLLLSQYFRSENLTSPNIIDANVEGDWLLHLYITQLDEETFTEMPVGLGELGEAIWVEDRWSELMPKIANESRKHGWCIAQFYDGDPRWKVFTVADFEDWIKEPAQNPDGKPYVIRRGIKFKWTDDLGNNGSEECFFDAKETYLVKYKEGDGKLIFAYSDLPNALLDIVYNLRQIKGQMDFIGSKPGFKHFIYGADDNRIFNLKYAHSWARIDKKDMNTVLGIVKGLRLWQ